MRSTTALPSRHDRRFNAAYSGGLVAAAATIGSLASNPDDLWYQRLDKPRWQPPRVAFPLVWSTLYSVIAATSTAALTEFVRRGDIGEARSYRTALAANLTLNSTWSWLFFRSHNLGAATVGAAALAASSLDLARRAGRAKPGLGWAMGSYAAWTGFATVLAGTVWRLNQKR